MRPTDAHWTQLRERIRPLYDHPPRAYHNWAHVEACLRELDRVRSLAEQPQWLEIAIWFHDCIYDPRRHDNEARSAALARDWLSESASEAAPAVAELVLITSHTTTPATLDAQLIVDIDLAILGQSSPTFRAYEQAIRDEYSFVPNEAFRAGRAQILQAFLNRPFIYCTSPFRALYEHSARANLKHSVDQLSQ